MLICHNNNNNEYLERLTWTGLKCLHVLYKYILSKFNTYSMNAHTHTCMHTHRLAHAYSHMPWCNLHSVIFLRGRFVCGCSLLCVPTSLHNTNYNSNISMHECWLLGIQTRKINWSDMLQEIVNSLRAHFTLVVVKVINYKGTKHYNCTRINSSMHEAETWAET